MPVPAQAITLIEVAYYTVVYLIVGLAASVLLRHTCIKPFDVADYENKQRSKTRLFFSVCWEAALIGVVAYLIRNTVQRLPTPFHTFPRQLPEYSGGGTLMVMGLLLCVNGFERKLNYFSQQLVPTS